MLVIRNDDELIEAVARLKQLPGKSLGIPGGVRTGQTFARLGLVDEFNLLCIRLPLGMERGFSPPGSTWSW